MAAFLSSHSAAEKKTKKVLPLSDPEEMEAILMWVEPGFPMESLDRFLGGKSSQRLFLYLLALGVDSLT